MTDERAALPPADFRWVQIGAYNVRGGRVVEWEILNAADERPDGIYALFAAKAPDHHGMQSKAARAALSAQPVGAVQPPTDAQLLVAGIVEFYNIDADNAKALRAAVHPTESAGEAVQRPAGDIWRHEATLPMLEAYSRVIAVGSELDGSMVWRAMLDAAPKPADTQRSSTPEPLTYEQIDAAEKAYASVAEPAWTSNRHRPALAAALRAALAAPPSSPEPRWCEFARQLIERGGPMVRAAYNDIPGPSCVDMGSWMQDAMRTMRALAAPPSSTPPDADVHQGGAPAEAVQRPAIATDLRAEFEAWFMDYCGTGPQDAVFDQPSPRWLARREDDEYEETRVRDAWYGWAGHAARRALAETQRSSHTAGSDETEAGASSTPEPLTDDEIISAIDATGLACPDVGLAFALVRLGAALTQSRTPDPLTDTQRLDRLEAMWCDGVHVEVCGKGEGMTWHAVRKAASVFVGPETFTGDSLREAIDRALEGAQP